MIFLEWMIIIKNRDDYFTKPFPIRVIVFWIAVLLLLILISVYLIRKECCSGSVKPKKKINLVEPVVEVEEFNPSIETTNDFNHY